MLSGSQRPLKILCLTSHAPQGEDQGARLRARHLLRQLSRFAEVRVILAGAYEEYSGHPSRHADPSQPSEIMDFIPWKIRGFGERLRYELGSSYLNTHGVQAAEVDRRRLIELMDGHDLVWVHGLRIANGFKLWKWPRTILDIDDIPSEVNKSVISRARVGEAKLRAVRQFFLWKRHEARLFERFAAMAVCSEPDRAHFGNRPGVFVVHNGFEAPSAPPVRRPSVPARIGFIGSLEYPPNANGIRWFLRKVWPAILANSPDVTLRIVGKNSQDSEWRQGRNVEGLGWLGDADAEMATWSMTIVPVFEGGGTRVKISNAFSRKCPVVSTRLGAYGYDVAHDRELLIADDAPGFAAACMRLLHDDRLADRLATTAWDAFLAKWTWDANGPRLEQVIEYVLARNRDAIAP